MKSNSSLYSFVGSELKNLRKYRNITQDKLSQISGVSVKTIRNIEKGYVDCNVTTLFLLFESLDIDPLDIFNDINGSSVYLTNSIITDLDKDIKALNHNLIPNHLSKLKEIKNNGITPS